ncbi:hypothetical protein CEXT_357331 [Caerostris extrusa]|uniref:Uncharacterized protein n=1 Tax=Caerostris extrusa TaxID=172846 RepID=A0AAV4NLK3_CAEEX|nr:hypothetical protein CEXT_357331 [Caerostris extrusa]
MSVTGFYQREKKRKKEAKTNNHRKKKERKTDGKPARKTFQNQQQTKNREKVTWMARCVSGQFVGGGDQCPAADIDCVFLSLSLSLSLLLLHILVTLTQLQSCFHSQGKRARETEEGKKRQHHRQCSSSFCRAIPSGAIFSFSSLSFPFGLFHTHTTFSSRHSSMNFAAFFVRWYQTNLSASIFLVAKGTC